MCYQEQPHAFLERFKILKIEPLKALTLNPTVAIAVYLGSPTLSPKSPKNPVVAIVVSLNPNPKP